MALDSKIAKRIEAVKETGKLDLSFLELQQIPDEVLKLTQLKSLDVSRACLESCSTAFLT
jgi:Leucine-rich repeat (LRR) protein